jgi:UDP-glucose 4-epimerase
MKIFLTGGSGFVGSHVLVELLKHGHCITALVRNRGKVPSLATRANVQLHEGSLTDRALLNRLIPGHDAIVHNAVNCAEDSGESVLLGDTLPSVVCSDIAIGSGVKHFIYTSSTAVNDTLYLYGDFEENAVDSPVSPARAQRPATLYGATKAASENYLLAQSFRSSLRVNCIRPGYVFGNPALEGGVMQPDERFRTIVRHALSDEPIEVVRGDGTQFIWAPDLAKLYSAILHSSVNRRVYYGLSENHVTWETIARSTIDRCRSGSALRVFENDGNSEPLLWDVSLMREDFGLFFDSAPRIVEHIDYCLAHFRDVSL